MSLNRASSINDSHRSNSATPSKNVSKENIDLTQALPVSVCLERIELSTDMMASEAERLFYDSDYQQANKIITK